MSVMSEKRVITAAGGAGVATGNAQFSGFSAAKLLAVFFDYSASTPATADVTISSNGVVIVARNNTNTDAWVYPRTLASDGAGAALTGSFVPFVLTGNISVDLAQSNAAETVAVTLVVEA